MSESKASDPFQAWRKLLESQMESWSKSMAESMGSEAFAAALGRQMETFLSTHGQLQRRLFDVMEQYLKGLNLPSRTDVSRLAAQVGAVEAKVDDVDARTEEMLDLLRELRAAVAASGSPVPTQGKGPAAEQAAGAPAGATRAPKRAQTGRRRGKQTVT